MRWIDRRVVQNVLLVVCGTLVGLAFAEGLVRVFWPAYGRVAKFHRYVESERGKFARYDRDLGWDGLENAEGTFEWVDTRHAVRQNRFGYRGAAYDYRRTGQKRMVVLGDSFTWGFGVENPQIFTSIMERQASSPLEIVNLGVSGYGTDQEYLLWRGKGHLWSPDRVVLMVTVFTDFFENTVADAHGYSKPLFQWTASGGFELSNVPVPPRLTSWDDGPSRVAPPRSLLADFLLAHSALANVVAGAALKSPAIRGYLETHDIVPARLAGYDWECFLYMGGANARAELSWATMFRLISELEADVTRRGADFSVVIIPSPAQVYPELWERFSRITSVPSGGGLAADIPSRRVREWCESKGIHVIDLLPVLRAEAVKNPYLYYPINRHWTADGHALVAKVLLSAL